MQVNVIILMVIGYKTHWVQFIQMKHVTLLNHIKIAWKMGDQTENFCTGSGLLEIVSYLFLILKGFSTWCVVKFGHLLVIPFLVTMFSPCSARFLRFVFFTAK